MSINNISICKLLFKREIGFLNKNKEQLNNVGVLIAEKVLLERENLSHHMKTMFQITDKQRSIYAIEYDRNGSLAAITHSNRTVSIVKASTMKKIGEFTSCDRTIWTLAFHPEDSNILAVGSLGGYASVYKKFKLYRLSSEVSSLGTTNPITSMCFHPIHNYICFSTGLRIVIWDWELNNKLFHLDAEEYSSIRFVKFNPVSSMLITGIKKNKIFINKNYIKLEKINLLNNNNNTNNKNYTNNNYSYTELLFMLLRIINYVLYCLEKNLDIFTDKLYIWDSIIKLIEENYQYNNNINKNNNFNYRLLQNFNENFINPVQDFNPTLQQFKNRSYKIYKKLINKDKLATLEISNNKNENDLIKQFVDGCYKEAEYVHKKCRISINLFKRVYLKMKSIRYFLKNDKENNSISCEQIEQVLSTGINKHSDDLEYYTVQAWDFEENNYPDLRQEWRNIVATCTIHNDTTVAISKCGSFIVSYKKRLLDYIIEIHSLNKCNLGERIHYYETDVVLISLSLSPSNCYLICGARSSESFAIILEINQDKKLMQCVYKLPNTYDEENHKTEIINCISWAKYPGDGIFIGFEKVHFRYIRNF